VFPLALRPALRTQATAISRLRLFVFGFPGFHAGLLNLGAEFDLSGESDEGGANGNL
jgi:hypothetical protein